MGRGCALRSQTVAKVGLRMAGRDAPDVVDWLAAEGSGTIGIAIRRWRRQADAADFGQATAARTCWRNTVRPPHACRCRARWLVELIRCRAGESAEFEVRLAMPNVVSPYHIRTPCFLPDADPYTTSDD